jgi:uncharacterized protein
MDKREIILLLLKLNQKPIVGTTRLQKLLFLIEKEFNIKVENGGFKFEPYKYGPASKELYDDLDFLTLIGYIEKSDDKEKLLQLDINNIENYNSNIFLSDKGSSIKTIRKEEEYENLTMDNKDETFPEDVIIPDEEPDEKDSIVYKITEEGIKFLKDNNLLNTHEANSIIPLVKKFGNYSITSLLQYVYRNYPDYTGESEIKDKIL